MGKISGMQRYAEQFAQTKVEAAQRLISQYMPALNSNDPAADVMQEHMDRVLAEIISGKAELIRFPDRYPHAKKIKYGR